MLPSREFTIGTAGHIDHGKTALVRALTGVDTDRLPAEKERGITIDLGFAAVKLGSETLALVDVPGHERFLRNMLAGATGVDLALLVVAADDSVMPQTREHLEILKLLGLRGGVIALTKCDLVEGAWLDLVEADVRALVAGSFLESAAVVRTSATAGLGIDELKGELGRLVRSAPPREDLGPFRMSIDRVFTRAGHGTIVTGTVASGSVSVDDSLECLPGGLAVRVRGLHRHDRPVESISRGSRAAINLAGVHHTQLERGHTLAAQGFLRPSQTVGVRISVSADSPRAIRHRGRYRLHLGTAEESVTLALLEGDRIEPGETALGELRGATGMVAISGQPFVLREESPATTVGGGVILSPTGRKIRRRDLAAIGHLSSRDDPDPMVRLSAAIATLGAEMRSDLDATREAALPLDGVRLAYRALAERGELVEVRLSGRKAVTMHREALRVLESRVLRVLSRLHDRYPRQSAIRRSHLLSSFRDLVDAGSLEAIVDRLRERGEVTGDAHSIARMGFEPKLSHSERKLKDSLLHAIEAGAMSPPDSAELASTAGARASVVPELLALLVEEGRIVAIGTGLFFASSVEAAMRARVAAALEGEQGLTMAGLRDLLGTTRKYAVPIGEYLDRVKLTRRDGDVRRLATDGGGA